MKECVWGKKVGMTQLFSNDGSTVIPVTGIYLGEWYILEKKIKKNLSSAVTKEIIVVGMLRDKFKKNGFDLSFLKNKKKYFLYVRECRSQGFTEKNVGDLLQGEFLFKNEMIVDVAAVSIGKGFQGSVKRHGFSGGRGSHGDKLGRKPGSLSGLRTQGRVFKGKRLPGRCGLKTCTIKNLPINTVDHKIKVLFVKGSVPGKSGSLVRISWIGA